MSMTLRSASSKERKLSARATTSATQSLPSIYPVVKRQNKTARTQMDVGVTADDRVVK